MWGFTLLALLLLLLLFFVRPVYFPFLFLLGVYSYFCFPHQPISGELPEKIKGYCLVERVGGNKKEVQGFFYADPVRDYQVHGYPAVIKILGTEKPCKGEKICGTFNLKGDNFENALTLTTSTFEIEKSTFSYVRDLVNLFRQKIEKHLEAVVENRESALFLKALLLGKNSDKYLSFCFQNLGISHLMAVSGFHVGIFFFLFLLLLSPVVKTHSFINGSLFATCIYAMATGFSPPVFRAFFTLLLVTFNQKVYRRVDALNILAGVFLIEIFFRPLSVISLGSQLSYSATLGIICLLPLIQELRKKVPFFIFREICFLPVAISLAASVPLIALLLFYFHTWNPFSLVLGVFFTPFISILMGGGLIFFLLSFVIPVGYLGEGIDKYVKFLFFLLEEMPSFLRYHISTDIFDLNRCVYATFFCFLFLIYLRIYGRRFFLT